MITIFVVVFFFIFFQRKKSLVRILLFNWFLYCLDENYYLFKMISSIRFMRKWNIHVHKRILSLNRSDRLWYSVCLVFQMLFLSHRKFINVKTKISFRFKPQTVLILKSLKKDTDFCSHKIHNESILIPFFI